MGAILCISCSYDSPSSGGVNFEQLHILTKYKDKKIFIFHSALSLKQKLNSFFFV